MYKFLLAWRYLRTRFIALASIVSVTLGVATLIVVNSVMAGFVDEMKDRLHGILSDVEIASAGLGVITWPDLHVDEIESVLGDDLEAVTYVCRVPALLNFECNGQPLTQQIMLLGVEHKSFGEVTDFKPFLTNKNKQETVSFLLENSGYDEKYGKSGWEYRRAKELNRQRLENLIGRHLDQQAIAQVSYDQPIDPNEKQEDKGAVTGGGIQFAPLPGKAPDIEAFYAAKEKAAEGTGTQQAQAMPAFDPSAELRPQLSEEEMFDASKDQHTGIILGIAISSRRFADPDTGEMTERFMFRPGDDVQVTLPSAGSNPRPVTENCTVVDFYSSNMHEYDSSFAFMPLKEMQELRGMIDPVSGASSVSAIQIKVRDGANLSEIRDKLIARFPPEKFPAYMIQTWQDTQRPLLSAVAMELTILNILLFLIIAVAGFGILATFFMIVVEKTKDIGILKALGAPSRGVMSIFLSYGVSLGSVGTGAGIVIGLVFVYYINDIANVVQSITGQEIFDPTIYYFNEIPTIVNPVMILWVALGAITIAVLASVLPALRAARLHPVEALRYE